VLLVRLLQVYGNFVYIENFFEFYKTCWKSVFVRRAMPRVRTLGQIPQLSDFERGRILEIARRIGRSVGTILRCCQAVRHGLQKAVNTGQQEKQDQ
jgi:hypothetical protein